MASQADRYCVSCGRPLNSQGKPSPSGKRQSIPSAWVEEKTKLLKQTLPTDVQARPFYPDDLFYVQYYADPLSALHYKAQRLFDLLGIQPSGCVIDFCDEKELTNYFSSDAAGLYTQVKDDDDQAQEVILINAKYKDDPLAVGAILAHEMMHLYLSRLNLRLQDTQENELLTDLATINTGLSILILNGMSYSSDWWLTIIMTVFGRIYWRSEELAFGYFKPAEYGDHSLGYFKERNIAVDDIIGYVNPTSRHFIHCHPSLKSRASTQYMKILERQNRRSNIIKGAIAGIIVLPLMIWGIVSEQNKQNLKRQMENCKAEVTLLGAQIDADTRDVNQLERELNNLKESGHIEQYNGLVEPYNSSLRKINEQISGYEARRVSCNEVIQQYNRSR
ncbi:MAG: hypothetical protein ABSG54_16840 [Terriglobia bacterium]